MTFEKTNTVHGTRGAGRAKTVRCNEQAHVTSMRSVKVGQVCGREAMVPCSRQLGGEQLAGEGLVGHGSRALSKTATAASKHAAF